ncbi:MAG TPA: hypothetical protein VD963_04810 [Phycisphaerales bacterium]|nr:hypothetical protein [Phycisphaerales bacterium]
MTTADPARLIRRLRERYGHAATPEPAPCAIEPDQPVLAEFVRSFMVWESTLSAGTAACRKLEKAVVDFNELRVCLPDELVRVIGPRYPLAPERAQRLRAALNDLYARQHSVSLQHLPALGKREAEAFLASLNGVPGFVSARVTLLALGGHALPVDSCILGKLLSEGIVPADATPESAAGSLERRFRAGELAEAYLLLQAWSDAEPVHLIPVGEGAGGGGKGPGRKDPARPRSR